MAVDEDFPPAEAVPTRALGAYAWLRIVDDAAGPAIAVLTGELDLACADALTEALREALAAAPRGLELDMSKIDFCDCAALRAFHATRQLAHELDRPFTIGPRSAAVTRLLELTETTTIPLTDIDRPPADTPRPQPQPQPVATPPAPRELGNGRTLQAAAPDRPLRLDTRRSGGMVKVFA